MPELTLTLHEGASAVPLGSHPVHVEALQVGQGLHPETSIAVGVDLHLRLTETVGQVWLWMAGVSLSLMQTDSWCLRLEGCPVSASQLTARCIPRNHAARLKVRANYTAWPHRVDEAEAVLQSQKERRLEWLKEEMEKIEGAQIDGRS